MAVTDLTMAPVDEMIAWAALLDPPVQVSMDPADLNPPAGWLALDEVRMTNLAGQLELRCSLYLVSPDIDPQRALALLAPLLNSLRAGGLTPDGPVVPIGVVMPDSGVPKPSLRVPVHLYTESE